MVTTTIAAPEAAQPVHEQQDTSFYPSVELALQYELGFGQNKGLLAFLDLTIPLLPPGSRVLDAGCGTGRPVAVRLAAAGHAVTGIDVSHAMVALSRQAVPSGRFHVADMRAFVPPPPAPEGGVDGKPPGSDDGYLYDAVFNILSLFVLSREDIEALMTKWAGWLRPGGLLCICTIAAEDLVGRDAANPTKGGTYDADGLCVRGVQERFMSRVSEYTLFTREGWARTLADRDFKIKATRVARHVPPPEADCGPEDHYFIVAQKI